MKVLSLMWGCGLGGVRTCFLTYARLSEIEPSLEIRSVCIDVEATQSDVAALRGGNVDVVSIRNRLDFSWLRKCASIIGSFSPDVIFTHGFNGPVVVEVLRRAYRLDIPMLCSYHSEYQAPSANRRLIAPLFNGAMHWLYRKRAAGVLGVSAFTKRTLLGYGIPEGKIAYVLHGISERAVARRSLSSLRPALSVGPGCVVLGVASRLDAIKGLSYLIEALAMIREKCHVHLVVVGEGPEKERLCELTRRLGLSGNVSFVGYQTNVSEWLEAMDVFCLPSLSETLSLGLLEALRAGKAIVATHVGGIIEAVKDEQEALLVPPEQAPALATAILRLADDATLRGELGANARKRFEGEFTESRMRRQLADWLLSFGKEREV